MKEFVEKLIERLKDEERDYRRRWKYKGENEEDWLCMKAMQKVIGIVEQLAEEHKECALCYLGSPCEYQNKDVILPMELLADNNGWISVDDELPEMEADVLLSLRSLDVYTGFRANTEGCFYVEGEGYVEFENVLAWQPLPAPYKKGE